eukprot:TRINITY_DN2685_c0_g1_i1.p1 TRINITY_DN2685_c0_g1~~TRINITY_DN2685_c0_g1_i1.p1  ORF type:complete len:1499 (+),score=394.02 TRINITY_DN2685_c0_g1_i1:18-4514(+)
MSTKFFQQICEPFQWGPYEEGFLTMCFSDLILLAFNILLLLTFGIYRLVYAHRRGGSSAAYTKPQGFTLIASFLCLVLPCAEIILATVHRLEYGLEIPITKWVHVAGSIFTWTLALVIAEMEYRHGMKNGWVLVVFWILSSTIGGIRIQAYINENDYYDSLLIFVVLEFLLSTLISLNALAFNEDPYELLGSGTSESASLVSDRKDSYNVFQQDNEEGVLGPSAPEPNSNILQRMSFSWLNPVLETGHRRPLSISDLPALWPEDEPSNTYERFNMHWEDEKSKEINPSLAKAIWRMQRRTVIISGFIKIVNDVMAFASPLLLEQLVNFVADPSRDFYEGIILAFAMLFSKLIELVAGQAHFQYVYRASMQVESGLLTTLFTKAMKLSSVSLADMSLGEIVNLQAVDAGSVANAFWYIHSIWSAPIQLIVCLSLLGRQLGVAALGTILVLVIVVPAAMTIWQKMFGLGVVLMGLRDERTTILNEVIQGIQVIKFFAWERSFVEKITEVRTRELNMLKTYLFLNIGSNSLWAAIPVLLTVTCFFFYTLQGNELGAATAFSSLSLINMMTLPLVIFPILIGFVVQASVASARVQKFLVSSEIDPDAITPDPFGKVAIAVKDASFAWKKDEDNSFTEVLENINLSFNKELVAIIGEVGSGKSSLLSALLGEMKKTQGTVNVKGSVAYVPQQAWLMNATLKNNILFGLPLDEKRYKKVIKLAELEMDLKMLPAGDATEIGEKGINLSGGQKQRVAIARSLYADADIYLMDDPLSALDAHVGKEIFNKCIREGLAEKTRVLVTHQLQHLKKCDRIVYLDSGKVVEVGTYDELMAAGLDVAQLLTKHTNVDAEEEEPEEEKKKKEEEDKKKEAKDGSLISAEKKAEGSVKWDVYGGYIQSLGGALLFFLILLLLVSNTASEMITNLWLSHWSDSSIPNATIPVNDSHVQQLVFKSADADQVLVQGLFPSGDHGLGSWFYMLIYAALGVSSVAFTFFGGITFAWASVNSSKRVHETMLEKIIRSPMSFFDTVPTGRILNRFSSDTYTVDAMLPGQFIQALLTFGGIVSIIVIISTVTPIFLVSLVPLAFLYKNIQRLYLNTSRDAQRLKATSKSPIYSLFSESISGLATIRAYDRVNDMIEKNISLVHTYQKPVYTIWSANRWLAIRLEFLGAVVVFLASLAAVLNRLDASAGQMGLSVTYALLVSSKLNWFVRISTEVENAFVCVERCLEYSALPTEAAAIIDSNRPAQSWPKAGAINFKNASLRYRPGLPLVLKNLSCSILPGEKVGVVGRTGAGKSSLMLALFRIIELDSGRIEIDGVDTSSIGLEDLRSKLAMIPQDPTLYTGTLRFNLDPFNNYSDKEIMAALDAVYLTKQLDTMENGLDFKVTEGGGNLSLGTKQLLCLARALLRNSKVIVMDEATASVDYETDLLIQKTIHKAFAKSTVITVAHRINTIISYNKVMVLDKGEILEYDSPDNLLSDPSTIFASLASQGGIDANTPKMVFH